MTQPTRSTTRRLGRLLPMLGLIGCGAGGSADTEAATPQAPLTVPAGYQLVWADEFDKPGLPDPARWSYDTGMNKAGWHNRELQYYSAARPENSVVRDGKLVITARKEALNTAPDWGGQRYTSVRLISRGKGDWTYGFVSVRAKLPCGLGTWPAIWMLGSQGDWPAAGELDILEQVGKDPDHVFSTVHTTSGSGGQGKGGGTRMGDVCKAFHDYQMHWTPSEIRFGIDGKHHFTYPNAGSGKAQWPFDAPQFLILNIAIGGDLGGPVDDTIFPVTMEVESVRVWQKPR
jgi:beta-glucanase (GH16 family)